MSQILPGGHTSLDASPIEKIYFVVEGELTIETPDGETTLSQFDSCRIAPNEARALKNKTNKPVIVLLSMPLAAAGKMTTKTEETMLSKCLKRLILVALIASLATPAMAQTEVKIGIGFGIGFLPTFIMREMDLIEKHAKTVGLDVKTNYQRISGSSAMQDAVLSGSVDMGAYGVAAMLFAWDKARNTPQQIFGIAGVNSSPLVLVTNKPEVKKLADLAPTDKISMPALVSPQMYALQMISEKTFGPGQEDKLKPQVVALPHPEIAECDAVRGHRGQSLFRLAAVHPDRNR